jgi:hypothetical protein
MRDESDELGPPVRPGRDAAVGLERRRWTRSALVGAAASLIVHTWMLSAGNGNLFRWGRQSDLYDAQARSLLDGTFAMDQRVLGIESFGRGDQHFMYFGPVPAVLRLPIVAVTRQFDGRLAALSMLLALVVAAWALLGLGWRLRSRVLADGSDAAFDHLSPVSRFELVAVAVTFFAILGGSSLLYASSRTWVYHEAILWGVALTLASLGALLAWLDAGESEDPTVQLRAKRYLVSASIFATLALLTRPSVGSGALAAIGIIAARELTLPLIASARGRGASGRTGRTSPSTADRVLFLGVVAMPIVVYSVVNWIKFRRLLGVPFDQQGFTLLNERRREMLAANGGTLFNFEFIPTNLFTYLRPDLVRLDGSFPYIFPVRPTTTIGSPFYDLIDFTAGLPTTMPLLLVLAVIGLATTLHRTTDPQVRALWPLLAGCALGTVAVLAIGYLANRYQSDFLPFLIVAALIGLPVAVRWLERRADRRWQLGGAATAVVLVGLGATTNLALAYSYQRALSPSLHPDAVAGYLDNQQRADEWFGDGRLADVIQVEALPTESRTGDIAIVGECAGLYLSDGVISIDNSLTHWRLAELSASAGRAEGTITIPRGEALTLPMIELAAGQTQLTVSVEVDEANGVMVVNAVNADGENRGPDLPLRTGQALRWEVFADPFVGRYEVYLDGRVAVFGELPVGDRVRIFRGQNLGVLAESALDESDGMVQVCEALRAAVGSDDGGR